jgi:hypothetical protein
MAAGEDGYLYVMLDATISFAGSHPPTAGARAHGQLGCSGAAVFTPGPAVRPDQFAKFRRTPNCRNVRRPLRRPMPRESARLRSPRSRERAEYPDHTRSLGGLGLIAVVTTDEASDVYALSNSPNMGEVFVYWPTGTTPLRTITFVAPHTYAGYAIEYRGRYLYVQDIGQHSVDIYDAASGGSLQPIFFPSRSPDLYPYQLAVGP